MIDFEVPTELEAFRGEIRACVEERIVTPRSTVAALAASHPVSVALD